jgi:hypothetical protein
LAQTASGRCLRLVYVPKPGAVRSCLRRTNSEVSRFWRMVGGKHYEQQTGADAVAEDEAAFRRRD